MDSKLAKQREYTRDPILDTWPEDVDSGCNLFFKNPPKMILRLWNNWTFSYMHVVLEKGALQSSDESSHLTSNDLFAVPVSMESENLVKKFHQHHSDNHGEFDATALSDEGRKKANRRLLYALWKIARPSFIPAGFCELLVVLCGTAMPLVVMELLNLIEDNHNKNIVSEGLPLAIALGLISILNGFGNHRHRHLAMKTGVALRAAVVNIIYEHIIRLSPQGKTGLTSGEVTNLVAVDAQKIYEVTQEGHLIWALPLSIVLVTYFLYDTLGPSTLVGIVVLIGFVPLIQGISAGMMAARQRRVKYTDERVETVSNMLQGIKVTKLNNYEAKYHARITETRENELHHLSIEMAIWATTLVMTVASPVLATGATFATYVLIDEDNILTPAETFGVLLLFSALRFPINFAGRLIGKATQALSAARRIALFLERPIRDDTGGEPEAAPVPKSADDVKEANKDEKNDPLKLSHASFRIGETVDETKGEGKESMGFTVSEFNFSIGKGEVLAVCGPVGSGKSTLLNGILDEAVALGKTSVTKRGQTAYVPQSPFILNQTVRDNILFGLEFDQERYNKVLDACCLRPDFQQLGEAGDLTEIGERGVTLSGGQKQRISLARAAYTQASLYILDDPFSALDSGTGKTVFERLIASPDALLKDSAVLLVTHASHFITNRAVDKILLIVDGHNRFLGSWEELAHFNPNDINTRRAVDHIKSTVREDTEETDSGDDNSNTEDWDQDEDMPRKGRRLIGAEEREHGTSSMKTWLLWFKRAGGVPFIAMLVLLMAIDRFIYVSVEWFLTRWTSAEDDSVDLLWLEFPPQTDGLSAQAKYLKVYASLLLLSVLATALRAEWAVTGGARATRTVFASMLTSVLKAPISYFETVPMGRILNRFTYDTDVNDVTLTQAISMFMISCGWYVAGVVVQATILPWSVLAILPVSFVYWKMMMFYRMTGPDLQRIDALSRSPLQSMVSECLEGSTSIRVFLQHLNFLDRFRDTADTNSSALLNFVSAQRWFGARMELLGSVVVLATVMLVVCLNESMSLDPGLVGMLIMWSANFTITLNFLVDTFSETEAAITAIERVDAMADLPFEKPMETDDSHRPPENWPEQGILKFDNVSLRYREGLPLALNGLSFEIPAGKSCGVVGRTGAGKSSITVALFRLVEIEGGQISLDGVDLGPLGLTDVRGRGMSIIPQDPFLAGATLRECLDPFNHHDDVTILEALASVRLGSSNGKDDASFLSTKLEEGGSNYSVGERQLLNLARALLSQPKVLVLDEATASIDGETDAFIQKMLRTRFPNTTLMTIAHRLNTIMDNDMVLVMDEGRAVEFGPPATLLEDGAGVLSELVDATGSESSKALREMAIQAELDRSTNN